MKRIIALLSCLVVVAGALQCAIEDSAKKDCGYMGIDQIGCEGKGCCWTPSSTQGTPWCYYGMSTPVPAPVSTPSSPPVPSPVYIPTVAPIVDTQCVLMDMEKKDCGYPGINQAGCESDGCCWQASSTSGTPWCFYVVGSPAYSPVPAPVSGPTSPPVPTAPTNPQPLPSCQIFSENQCQGSQSITDPSFEDHRWFTPSPQDADYKSSFQSYYLMAAHVHLVYTDSTHTSCTAEIIASHRDQDTMEYIFNGISNGLSPSKKFTQGVDISPVSVQVKDSLGNIISLDPIDFLWDAPAVHPREESKGDYRNGQKGAIVELFMWPHTDVAKECQDLAKYGYMGVKLFPANEQVMSLEPFNNDLNPWYFAYQPVSYRLQGRMGSRDDLRSAIRACRSVGVRVYADAVINHMTGGGNDANPHHRNPGAGCALWGEKNSSLNMNALGSAPEIDGPSPMYTQDFVYTVNTYTGKPASQEYPAAHWGPTDFHCEKALNSWTDGNNLNSGWLSGLVDINTEKDSVQERLADYLTDLISIGFSGFRVDAAKHISPDDLVMILTKVKRNLGGVMPEDWITWLEILLGGESDMLMCNVNSGYNYGGYLESALFIKGWSQTDVNKVKIWNSGYPKEPQNGYCSITQVRNAIQNDDHDQQNPGSSSRDMGDQGCVLIKGCPINDHRNFEMKLFSNPNGASDNNNDYPIRLILSSYYWQGGSQGVPDGLSECSKCVIHCDTCHSTTYLQAYNASSTGYDSGFTRPHRDTQIINAMRSWMKLSPL